MSIFKGKSNAQNEAPKADKKSAPQTYEDGSKFVKDEDGNVIPQYVHDTEFQKRREGELQHVYNERVPVQFQPVVEVGNISYLGKKRA